MDSYSKNNALQFLEIQQKIGELENKATPLLNDGKEFIMERLLEFEQLCNQNGMLIKSNLCIKDSDFYITYINPHPDGTVAIHWREKWDYGNLNEGMLEFTFKELFTGNFNTRIEAMKTEKKWKEEQEQQQKLEQYKKKKKELEELEALLGIQPAGRG